MKSFIGLLTICYCIFASADYENLVNYRDPVDGESLHGWHGPLEGLKAKLNPNKNYAVAILLHPVNAFLFQDVRWFRSTVVAVRKELESNAHGKLGHFQVAWSCKVPGNKRMYGMTGQTGERQYQGFNMLTKLGYGMSLFFANFTDGYLQSSPGSAARVAPSPYGFTWVAFEIGQEDCEQGLFFLDQYIESKAYQNFSFVKDPNQLQGGGCTSFAAELLFQLGAFKGKLINAWQTDFEIPMNTLRNPEASQLPARTELPRFLYEEQYVKSKVSIFSMVLRADFYRRKNHVKAHIYDTELILHSLSSMLSRAHAEQPQVFPAGYKPDQRKAFGLVRRRTNKALLMSGSTRDFVLVDSDLHFSFKRLTDYINHKDIPLPGVRYQELEGQSGLIFKKAVW